MKYKLLPCLLAIFLTGCDRTEVTLSFTPEMASFSNEFDFDPLRGPVKDFTQTLMDEQGEVTKRVSGTLSEEGCFDSLELLDLEPRFYVSTSKSIIKALINMHSFEIQLSPIG
ncbi:hypothetical protein C6B16_08745 [Escherichia coli]|nr:hypothetical protein C6B16_08745 [Escherichia coli]RCC66058.1 hypothetical protein C6B17_08965 [Escherichia coli]RCE07429.1 hypothetical protein C6B12_08720 [Escherichia coli]RCF37932.1 hypothetical protein C6B40_08740 [Escherichia coli]